MDPRLLHSHPPDQRLPYYLEPNPYLQTPELPPPLQRSLIHPARIPSSSSHSLPIPSLSSGQGFYTVESLERAAGIPHAAPPLPAPQQHLLAPADGLRGGGGPVAGSAGRLSLLSSVYERVPAAAAHPLGPPKVLPAAYDVHQGVRNPGLRSAYLSQPRLPEYPSGREPRFQPPPAALMRPAPAIAWNREPERDLGRGRVQPWNHERPDRAWVEEADLFRDRPRPSQRPQFQKGIKKTRPFELQSPRGSQFKKTAPAGKKKQQEKTEQERPGWCSLCEIDCITAQILKQHLGGKRHKLKLEQGTKETDGHEETKAITESNTPGKTEKDKATEKGKATGGGAKQGVKGTVIKEEANAGAVAISSPTDPGKKRPREKEQDRAPRKRRRSGVKGPGTAATAEKTEKKVEKKNDETVLSERCEMCNVTCNNRAILEAHFSGKKHAYRLKKMLREDEKALLIKTDDKSAKDDGKKSTKAEGKEVQKPKEDEKVADDTDAKIAIELANGNAEKSEQI